MYKMLQGLMLCLVQVYGPEQVNIFGLCIDCRTISENTFTTYIHKEQFSNEIRMIAIICYSKRCKADAVKKHAALRDYWVIPSSQAIEIDDLIIH